MSPREVYEPASPGPVETDRTGTTTALHWGSLALAVFAGVEFATYRAPPQWWLTEVVPLGVALLGRATRRLLWWLVRLGWERPWLLVAVGTLTGLWWAWGVVLALSVVGAGAVAISLGLIASGRLHERSRAVKSDEGSDWLGELGKLWPAAASRAGLHHPDDPARTPLLLGPVTSNGIGGAVMELDLAPALAEPGQIRDAVPRLRRGLRVTDIAVQDRETEPGERGGLDYARLHLYSGHPFREPVPAGWLVDNADAGGIRGPRLLVPVGPDITAEPVLLDARYSTMVGGATDRGKTGIELAFIAGGLAAGLPLVPWVLDNRGEDGGAELDDLSSVVPYETDSAAGWRLLRGALDVSTWRTREFRSLVGEREFFTPSRRHPALVLVITELLNLVQSRPPAKVADWDSFTGGWCDGRPSTEDWRAMIDEALSRISREGRLVAVAWHGAVAAAQMDVFGRRSRLRTVTPQRIAVGTLTDDDVDPILGSGALAAGARPDLIPHPGYEGTGYVRVGSVRPRMFRATYVTRRDSERLIVSRLRRSAAASQMRMPATG